MENGHSKKPSPHFFGKGGRLYERLLTFCADSSIMKPAQIIFILWYSGVLCPMQGHRVKREAGVNPALSRSCVWAEQLS